MYKVLVYILVFSIVAINLIKLNFNLASLGRLQAQIEDITSGLIEGSGSELALKKKKRTLGWLDCRLSVLLMFSIILWLVIFN